jgi:hypothetical protein
MTETSSTPQDASEAPDDKEYLDPDRILDFVRQQAARRDPALAHHYASMGPGRIQDAAQLAQQLLRAHRALLDGQRRGARTGRRKHAQEVYRLLASTNDATLVLAIAYLDTAVGTLPRLWSRPGD